MDVVAVDKTGTLTKGDTRLTDVEPLADATLDGKAVTADRVLGLAAGVQGRAEHHLAEATVEAAAERAGEVPEATAFQASVGKGVRVTVDRRTVHIGNRRYCETLVENRSDEGEPIEGLDTGLNALRDLQDAGKTSVLVACERTVEETDDEDTDVDVTDDWETDDEGDGALQVVGWIGFTDTVREGAADMVASLRDLGVEEVVMLTGDTEPVARRVAAEADIDETYAELLPEEKVDRVEALSEEHANVAMIGDGVNDAPAIATADLGVAMGGAGSDVALETADVVLLSDELEKIPYALGLSRATRRTLLTNIAIAFGAIVAMVIAILAVGLPLPLAVVGHEGSAVLVSLIGLRLIGYSG